MSAGRTPARASSSSRSGSVTRRCAVAWAPPFTRSGTAIVTIEPGFTSSGIGASRAGHGSPPWSSPTGSASGGGSTWPRRGRRRPPCRAARRRRGRRRTPGVIASGHRRRACRPCTAGAALHAPCRRVKLGPAMDGPGMTRSGRRRRGDRRRAHGRRRGPRVGGGRAPCAVLRRLRRGAWTAWPTSPRPATRVADAAPVRAGAAVATRSRRRRRGDRPRSGTRRRRSDVVVDMSTIDPDTARGGCAPCSPRAASTTSTLRCSGDPSESAPGRSRAAATPRSSARVAPILEAASPAASCTSGPSARAACSS